MPGMTAEDRIAVARASYEAYVRKDRVAIEGLLAKDFHFTSPLDNRLDRATYFGAAGRTASSSRISNSQISWPRATGCS